MAKTRKYFVLLLIVIVLILTVNIGYSFTKSSLYAYNFTRNNTYRDQSVALKNLINDLGDNENFITLSRINKLLAYNPSDEQLRNVYFIKGVIEQKMKLYTKYLNSFRQAVEHNDYLKDYALLELGNYYYKRRHYTKAIKYYKQIIGLNNTIIKDSVIKKLANLYIKLEQYTNAINLLNNVSDNRKDDEINYLLGKLYYKKNRYDDSFNYLYKVVNSDKESEFLYKAGRCIEDIIYKKKRYFSNSGKYNILIQISKAYYKIGEHNNSIRVLRKLPYCPDKFYWLGKNYQNKKEYDRATAYYKTVILKYPKSSLLPGSMYNRAKCNLILGYDKFAVKNLKSLIVKYPYNDFTDDAYYLLADHYLSDGKTSSALDYLRKIRISYPNNKTYKSSLWQESLAYFKQGNLRQASKILTTLKNSIDKDFKRKERVKILYWLGKINYQLKDYNGAITVFEELIKKYPREYYTYRAVEKLRNIYKIISDDINEKTQNYEKLMHRGKYSTIAKKIKNILNQDGEYKFSYLKNKDFQLFDYRDIEFELFPNPESKEHFYKYYVLHKLKLYDYALTELQYVSKIKKNDPKYLYNTACLYSEKGEQNRAIDLINELLNKYPGNFLISSIPRQLKWILCPKTYERTVVYNAYKNNVDPYMVFALIREESRFNFRARSHAGARGLMQIMPGTGRWIARQMGMSKRYRTAKLYWPEENIKMGTWYFSHLKEKNRNNIILALASYNGGWKNVEKWINCNNFKDIDEFVENIPFNETRNYVKKVLRSYNLYKMIYDNGYDIEITANSTELIPDKID